MTRVLLLLLLPLLALSGAAQAAPFVYVSNEDSNNVTVLDVATDTTIATIEVGKRPRGLRLSPDGRLLYVALSGSPKAPPGVDESKLPPADRSADGIGVVDLALKKVIKVLASGQDPETFDLSRDGKTLFVSNEETAEMSIVDVKSGQVTKKVRVGKEPEGVTLRPDGKVVYVTAEVDNQVFAIDVIRQKVIGKIDVGARPRSVVFTSNGKVAFVTCELSMEIAVVNGIKHVPVAKIPIQKFGDSMPARPMGAVLSPDGKTLYVTNGRGGTVSVIDVATVSVSATIPNVGLRPWGIAISKDGQWVYTANGTSNDVSVIDTEKLVVLKRLSVGQTPWGIVTSQ